MSDDTDSPLRPSGCLFALAILLLIEMLVHWGIGRLGWIDYPDWWWTVSWVLIGVFFVAGVVVVTIEKK